METRKLFEIYALEKAGLSCIEILEELVAKELQIPKEELANKYQEITNKINTYASGYNDYAFRNLIYTEYMNMLMCGG